MKGFIEFLSGDDILSVRDFGILILRELFIKEKKNYAMKVTAA
jgi:hypothetical protein